MRFQLEQSRKVAWEYEEEARRQEHDMIRAMNKGNEGITKKDRSN